MREWCEAGRRGDVPAPGHSMPVDLMMTDDDDVSESARALCFVYGLLCTCDRLVSVPCHLCARRASARACGARGARGVPRSLLCQSQSR